MTVPVAIHARGLAKSFGDKPVLRALDLTVPAGQFLAVVGRSGCGKSTLLRLIMGLETPTEGRLDVAARQGPGARIVFQEPRLLPWTRVIQNVEIGLGQITDAKAARAKAMQALAHVGLADRADDWPAALSGGQRQRVALARALVSGPALLALDEPLGALDALTRIEMQTLLETVWKAEGFTAVLVTHDVSEAVALGDRVILIEEGRVTLDLDIPLPRPRRRGNAACAALEGQILDRLMTRTGA
jgi:sulfonate transport system ATP-binding protein